MVLTYHDQQPCDLAPCDTARELDDRTANVYDRPRAGRTSCIGYIALHDGWSRW